MSYTIENALRYPNEKVCLFIDGANFYAAVRAINSQSIDFVKLREVIAKRCHLMHCYYFTAISYEEDGTNRLARTLDFLAYNDWIVITKDAKKYQNQNDSGVRTKGNMDIEFAVTAMKAAAWMDHAIFFTGDGDFISVVKYLQERGVKVTIVSTLKAAILSSDLRKEADHFVELDDLFVELAYVPKASSNEA